MPSSNPFSPLIEVGGGASVGPASGSVSASVGDHHASAAYVAGALLVLFLLWKARFRFSTSVG